MARDINITIGAKNMASKVLDRVSNDVKKTSNRVARSTAVMAVSIKKFAKAAAVAGAAVGAVGVAAVTFLGSQLQETLGKFNVVFGANADVMREWSKTTAAAMGTSRQEMLSMLSGMQDLLVPMGVSEDTATGMSKTFSKLAVDLGSFNNLDSASVFRDLQAAVTGSGEVMKKYGVVLTEAAVKQELVNMGLDPKNADDATKAQARLNLIMESTTAAQGDAIRTQGSFANQMKRLKSNALDLGASIGTSLMEPFAGVLQMVNKLMLKIKDFIDTNVAFNTAMKNIGEAITRTLTWAQVAIENFPTVWALAVTRSQIWLERLQSSIVHLFTVVIPDRTKWLATTVVDLFQQMAIATVKVVANMANSIPRIINTMIKVMKGEATQFNLAAIMVQEMAKVAAVVSTIEVPDLPELMGRKISDKENSLVNKAERLAAKLRDAFNAKFKAKIEADGVINKLKGDGEDGKNAGIAKASSLTSTSSRLLSRGAGFNPLLEQAKKQTALQLRQARHAERQAKAFEELSKKLPANPDTVHLVATQ